MSDCEWQEPSPTAAARWGSGLWCWCHWSTLIFSGGWRRIHCPELQFPATQPANFSPFFSKSHRNSLFRSKKEVSIICPSVLLGLGTQLAPASSSHQARNRDGLTTWWGCETLWFLSPTIFFFCKTRELMQGPLTCYIRILLLSYNLNPDWVFETGFNYILPRLA